MLGWIGVDRERESEEKDEGEKPRKGDHLNIKILSNNTRHFALAIILGTSTTIFLYFIRRNGDL